MANLPGLRINQYYYYIRYYNKFLELKIKRLGELADQKKHQQLSKMFQDLKSIYSKLNESLYINLLYSMGEIQSRFLSFPTVEFPIRISGPLIERLWKAKVLSQNQTVSADIYSRENAEKLMSVIRNEFTKVYQELETCISEIVEIIPASLLLSPPSLPASGERENKAGSDQQQ